MKKILATFIFVLLMQSMSLGAVSEDMSVYVRQDVFDAKMEALLNEIRGDIKVLSERMDKNFAILSERIDALDAKLTNKIEAVDLKLSARIDGIDKRIDGLDKRIDDLRNGFYLGLVIFGTLLGLPFFSKFYEEHKAKSREPSFTLEDVKRLIEENNIMLRQTLLRS